MLKMKAIDENKARLRRLDKAHWDEIENFAKLKIVLSGLGFVGCSTSRDMYTDETLKVVNP